MSMIKVEHLTFSYPSSYDDIFRDVNFQIDTNWKLGFVGRNGRGKTTFLNLLLGKYEYRGTIETHVQFDYFPFPIADKSKLTEDILQEVCPIAQEWEIMRELSYLNVDVSVLRRPFSTLSHGEQTKVLLAALFLNPGHFLLIDEPTNHLDVTARALVAAYLKRKRGFILVSHDRAFLDGCVDHILSLNRTNIELQAGNFSSWLANFQQRQASEQAQNEALKRDMIRLRQSSDQLAAWSASVESTTASAAAKRRAAKMMKRSKSLEARRQKEAEQKSGLLKNVETTAELKLTPLIYHKQELVSFSNAAPAYDGTPVCAPVSFRVQQGDRIALDGRNGSGKSSLLKLLCGGEIPHHGTVTVSSGLLVSYVPQDTSHLSGELSAFAEASQIDESLFKAILRKMGFERVQFEKNMAGFSDGQKKKVLLAKSLCEQAHLYIWDEPLNYIDIYSRMQIETLIQAFSPAMIFVEHDKAFRDTIATRTVCLSPERGDEIPLSSQ